MGHIAYLMPRTLRADRQTVYTVALLSQETLFGDRIGALRGLGKQRALGSILGPRLTRRGIISEFRIEPIGLLVVVVVGPWVRARI